MNSDEIRKKIIKDKFDKLELIVINEGQDIALVSDNNYGLYYGDTYNDFSINPYYFMFDYIGLGYSSNYHTLIEYVNYIISLTNDKFKIKIKSLGSWNNPRRVIEYHRDTVNNYNTYISNEKKIAGR